MERIALSIRGRADRQTVREILSSRYTLLPATTGKQSPDCDLYIVDPPSFRSLRSRIRRHRKSVTPVLVPVLLISDRPRRTTAGATGDPLVDDTLFKPFGKEELLSRVRLLLTCRRLSLEVRDLATERLRVTLYSIGDGVIATDRRGNVEIMNPIAEQLTGWKESEAKGKSLRTVFPIFNEQTRRKAVNPVQRVLRDGIVVGLANHTILRSRDGIERPIADAGAPIRDREGSIQGVVLVFRDQSRERAAQRAVEEARLFAESIVETVREPLVVLDDALEVVSANRSFYTVFRTSSRETIGRKIYDLGNGQWNIPTLRTLLEEILSRNTHFDDYAVTHDFERIGRRTMLLNARRLAREPGRSGLILLAIEDITDRRLAEEQREEAERRNRLIAELVSDYAYGFRVTAEGELVGEWVTEAFTKVFGLTLDQIRARGGWKTLVHPDDREIAFAHARKVATGETDVCEMRWLTAAGEIRWLRDYAKPLLDDRGRVVRVYGAAQDITDRKLAEEAIHEREQLFRQLADTTTTAIFIYQGERFVYVNHSCELITGYSQSELLNMRFWDVVHPDDADFVRERGLARQRGEDVPGRYDFRILRKDGSVRWIDFTAGFIQWQKKPAAIGTAFDITDRKLTEEALSESGQRYRTLFEKMSAGFVLFEVVRGADGIPVDLVILAGNAGFEATTGLKMENVKGRRLTEVLPGIEKDAADWIGTYGAVADSGKPLHTELKSDLLGRYYEVSAYQAGPNQCAVTFTDITERKHAEAALSESEERFRTLIAHAPEAIVLLDPDSMKFISVNQRACKLFEMSEKELLTLGPAELSPALQPDGRSSEASAAEKVRRAAQGESLRFEWTHRTATGKEIPCEVLLVRLPFGDRSLIRGSILDITERKKAEERVRESEALLRVLFENVQVGVGIADQHGRILVFNEGMIRPGGYTRDDIAPGFSVSDLYYDLAERQKVLALLQRDGSVREYPIRFKRKDGSPYEALLWLTPIVYRGQQCVQAVVQDLTELKRRELEAREAKELYERFFMDDLTGDYISTPNGRILNCNPAFAKIFGFNSVEEALRTNALELFAVPEDREKLMARLREQKKIEYVELEMRRRDGTPLYIIANIIGHFDEGGSLERIQGYLFDDTRRRVLEASLAQAQKLESLGTLASGIAHDFNNILGIILGHASLLEGMLTDPEKVKMSIHAIMQATQRGASLVGQMLTFARKGDVKREPVNINSAVLEIEKLLRETFPKNIVLRTDLEEGLPLVTADPTQVHQILLNLCVNARDAMPDGGTLTIATRRLSEREVAERYPRLKRGEYVDIAVQDSGIGMDRETVSRIFEPFFTTKGAGKGTGLGLSTVHGIVEGHGGMIDVTSAVGRGTTFHILLPAGSGVTEIQERAPVDNRENGRTVTGTILIIEDEELLRELLRALLEASGFSVLAAEDGNGGIELFREHRKDIGCVITDMGLPGADGRTVFSAIRAIDPRAKVIWRAGIWSRPSRRSFPAWGWPVLCRSPIRPTTS